MRDWHFELTDSAERDIDNLDYQTRQRILEKLAWFRNHFDITTPLPLGGSWRRFFKLRVGDWRVVYSVNAEERKITIYLIDHRDKIYKRRRPH